MSFARTKLLPPRPRPGLLVERPALQRRLAEALMTRRLVLLCAAAGYGKTAALAQQVPALPATTALAWIAADEGDDLALLLECLVAALEPWDPPWRTAPEAMVNAVGDATPRARRAIADELINTLAACEVGHGLIVIDDLHRVDDPAVPPFLDHLLERLPPHWTLVLATRREPRLALARLRAGGELAEFRPQDLRFDADDARRLVAAAGLDSTLADALLRRTDGWAAGLRLAIDAGSRGSPGGAAADRPLLEYLDTEVIGRLPEALRLFLLRSAVLPELSAERAAAVTGNPSAAALLDELLRHGLFVTPLDGAEPTLRLHDLLREALERRLEREHADELPGLLKRAAADEPDVRRRLAWLLRAGAVDEAEQSLAASAPSLLMAGDSVRVLRLVDSFPTPQRERSPLLAYVRGLASWPHSEWGTMDQSLAAAAAGFAATGQPGLALRARAWRILALAGLGQLDDCRAELEAVGPAAAADADIDLHAHLQLMAFWLGGALGPADAPAQHLGAMLRSLAGHADPATWFRCTPHFMFIGRPGLTPHLQAYADAALAVAGDRHLPLRGAALAITGWVRLWQGHLVEADAAIAQAAEDARWLGSPRSLRIPLQAFQSARAAMAGDHEGLVRHGQAMIDDVEQDPARRPVWHGVYIANVGRMAAAIGNLELARTSQMRLAAAPTAREWPFVAAARHLLDAAILLHEGDADAASALLEQAVAPLTETGILGLGSSARLLAACARLKLGDARSAATWLRPLLEGSVEPGAILMTGRRTAEQLAAAAWGSALSTDEIRRLADWLSLFDRCQGAVIVPSEALGARMPAAEVLSAREREVLLRLACGDSNKLIARALDLSPHTVKRHVANILDKLALGSRGQAAAWWLRQAPH